MDYLVHCPCGHPLDKHEAGGCTEERFAVCSCRRDQARALEDAIAIAATQRFYGEGAASPPTAVRVSR